MSSRGSDGTSAASSASSDASDSSGSESDSGSQRSDHNEESQDAATNASGSVSRTQSQESKLYDSESESVDPSESSIKKKSKDIRDMLRVAVDHPELYNVRRSGRQRREVDRLVIKSDEDKPKRKRKERGTHRKTRNLSSDDDDDESGSGSGSSDFSQGYRRAAARKARSRPQRHARSRPARRPAARKRPQYSSDDDSDDDRPRQSNRARATSSKAVSYKEQSEQETDSEDLIEVEAGDEDTQEEVGESIEKVLRQRKGKKGATGSITTYYNLKELGDKNADRKPGDEVEVQYLVKWKGWSHIHNTWESQHTLREQNAGGMKRLEKFKTRQLQIAEWRTIASPEEVEYYDCNEEMAEELIDKCCLVDRIISHNDPNRRSDDQNPEYLVKWQGLSYSESTLEDGKLIMELFPKSVEEYDVRLQSTTTPRQICKAIKYRPKFQVINDQPEYVGAASDSYPNGLELRDYQMEGLNWLVNAWCKSNSAILADEMGLGKTIQTVAFLSYLMNEFHVFGPFLMVVPLSTVAAWQQEFLKWAPYINVVVYLGDISSRQMIREHEWCFKGTKKLKFNVLVTTYEILLKDRSFLGSQSWAVMGVDEAHRLKNDDSLLYKSLVDFDSNHRVLITGTPLQNSLKELWSLLHFIMPDKFDSWENFEDRHQSADKTGFAQLHKDLEPFLLRRMKKDVEKSLPAKTEQILRVEMSKQQKQYYRWILTKNYKALNKGLKGSVSSFINIMMELKKCCNHCFLVRPPEEEGFKQSEKLELIVRNSGKLLLLDKLLLRLRETGHRVLIFSQMVRMLDILAEYMTMRRFQFQRLDGSIRGDVRKQAMDHFNADGSTDFCFLLSTRAGGLGVNLATADTVIIFDSDWNPQNDLQAQARAHRIGQKNQVSVYRLVTKNSVEEEIVERAKKKMVLDHLVIQRMDTSGRTVLNKTNAIGSTNPFNKDELNSILKFGAEELFKENEDEEEEPLVDLDLILNRAETRVAPENDEIGDELLSQFKVVNFNTMEDDEIEKNQGPGWEQIIPEEERKKIEQEEADQKLLEMNLGPRERKKVTDLNKILDEDYKGSKRSDSDSYEGSDDDSDDESKNKKRGRPTKTGRKSGVLGSFTNAEIRQFVKSYKKFPRPRERLDDIAGDAELQEKSHSELRQLCDQLYSMCQAAVKEAEQKAKEENGNNDNKKRGGASFKIGSVVINAKSMLQPAQDLEPVALVMPSSKAERVKYEINFLVKTAHFDCPWDRLDDSALLRGIYEYGMGSWEAIKMDPDLKLQDKILPDGDLKPQVKHLQSRADFLFKSLKKRLENDHLLKVEQKKPKQGKSSKDKKQKKEAKSLAPQPKNSSSHSQKGVKSKEFIEDSDSSDSDMKKSSKDKNGTAGSGSAGKDAKKKNKAKAKPEKKDTFGDGGSEDGEIEDGEVKEDGKKRKKRKYQKKAAAPVHITTSQTVAVGSEHNMETQLPKAVFNQCKEKMRPVKKYLKKLDNPEPGLEKDQLRQTGECLLKIGDWIEACLLKLHDPEVIKESRSNLWIFVSQFTEFEPDRLHKMYRKAARKRDAQSLQKAESQDTNTQGSYSQEHPRSHHQHQQHNKMRPPDHGSRQPEHKSRPGDHRRSYSEASEQNSENSRDGFGGPKAHAHNRSRDRYQDVKESESWSLSSPLNRSEERSHSRFQNSYNKPPNEFSKFYNHESSNKRYNQDSRGQGYSGGYNKNHGPTHWTDYGGGDYYGQQSAGQQQQTYHRGQGDGDPRRFNRKRPSDGYDGGRPHKDGRYQAAPPSHSVATSYAPVSSSTSFPYDPRSQMPVINTTVPPPYLPPPTTSSVRPLMSSQAPSSQYNPYTAG